MTDLKKTIKKLRAELAERDKIIATLLERIAVLEAEIAALKKTPQTPPSRRRPKIKTEKPRNEKSEHGGFSRQHQQRLFFGVFEIQEGNGNAFQKTVRRFVPEHKKAAALAKRFEANGESCFLFIEDTTLAPSNNFAEQDIRTLVMNRVVTQGVRSDGGNEWHQRFWTTVASCRRRGLNVMTFLRESLFRFHHGLSPPSLLPPLASG